VWVHFSFLQFGICLSISVVARKLREKIFKDICLLAFVELLERKASFMGSRCPTRNPPPAPPPVEFKPLSYPWYWSRARILWKRAVEQISRILRLRRRWNKIGVHLQLPRIQSLVEGLDRRRGRLVRTARVTSPSPPAA